MNDDSQPTGSAIGNSSEAMLELLYDELRLLAHARLASEKPGNTLQATALVHEAYLKLLGSGGSTTWDSEGHFFASAAEAMRRILVDSARSRGRKKRGGEFDRVSLSQVSVSTSSPEPDILDLDHALAQFERSHPEKAVVVKLRYFAGMTIKEIAEICEMSTSTVDNYWAYARAWLRRKLEEE